MASGSEILLAQQQHSDLSSIAQSRSLPAGYVFRAKLILMLAEGASFNAIKRQLQTTAPTIVRWKQRFRQHGLEGLDTYHPGQKPSVLTPALRARILSATRRKPSDGSTHWSCRKLASALGVSKDAVHRVWQEAGLKPHRLERYMPSDDPEFEPKAADILGLYLRPPQHAAVFCVDEKTAIQALDRLDPVLPLSPGRAERHGFEYYRHGTLSLVCGAQYRHWPRPRQNRRPPHQPRVRRLSPRGGRPVPASATDSHHPRQSLRAQNSGGPRVPPTTSASPVSLHAHLLVLAQPGRDLVRQDRTRGHRPRHLHLGFRLSSQTSPLHQRLLRQCSADPVEILRPHPPHPQ